MSESIIGQTVAFVGCPAAYQAFMAYEPNDDDDTGHMGLGSSAQFADDQEARLKFLTKFNMNDSDFNEPNPPWEYPHG
jgi:hypothetical protein